MKKVIFIGWVNLGRAPVDGETTKNQYIIAELKKFCKVTVLDFYEKNLHPWIYLQALWAFISQPKSTIILSTSAKNVYSMLKLFKALHVRREIIHWVVGGAFGKLVQEGRFRADVFNYVKYNLVQCKGMIAELEVAGVTNAKFVSNFKPISYYPDLEYALTQRRQSKKIRFVFISRIMQDKGCDYLLEAIRLLNDKGMQDCFVVDFYGKIDPYYQDVFLNGINNLDNANYSGLLDLRSREGYDVLSSYHAMLFPTFHPSEGFAGVFIDAFIAGLPVLASDWAHNAESIHDQQNGLLFPVHSTDALAQVMEDCITGKTDLCTMAQNARNEAFKFQAEKVLTADYLSGIGLISQTEQPVEKRHDTNVKARVGRCLAFIRYAINPMRFKAPEMDTDDWKLLYRLALKQAILGVVMEGVNRVKANGVDLPEDVMEKWASHMISIELNNLKANKVAAKLYELLENDGFRCCILKGQGNNLMYPNVFSRTPGDIDVWMAKAEGSKPGIKDIIKYVRLRNPKGRAIYHHIDYGNFKKIDVEIHYRPSFMNNLAHNYRLQKWFVQQADTQFNNRVELPGGVGTISVPTPEFNTIYQLVHIYNHILNDGIGLRHIIDYYYVMLALKDKESVVPTLRYLGLEKIAGAVMWVLSKMLGLEDKYLIVAPDARLGRVMANEILHNGNFGLQSKVYRNLLHDKNTTAWKFRLRRNIYRLRVDWRMLRYFPSECLSEPLFRIYHLFWRRIMLTKVFISS